MDDARINLRPSGDQSGFTLTVRRNCSISPQALLRLLAATAVLSFGIAIGFAVFGAWLVLPFVGLELAALAAAFYVCGRHAGDYERIEIGGGQLTVEIRDAEVTRIHRFNPHWARLVVQAAARDLRVAIRAHGQEVEVGRHLDMPGRELLADELRSRGFTAGLTADVAAATGYRTRGQA